MSVSEGLVSVSFVAGPIRLSHMPPHPLIGQQVTMNNDLHFSITADVARQWLTVLQTIATKEDK